MQLKSLVALKSANSKIAELLRDAAAKNFWFESGSFPFSLVRRRFVSLPPIFRHLVVPQGCWAHAIGN